MKYQIKDRDEFFIREDRTTSVVLFKEKHDQFILNETGLAMFNLILDNDDTELVLQELKNKYTEVNDLILRNDLENILRMLKMYDIVYLGDEIDNLKSTNKNILAVDENDYEVVGKFLEKNRKEDVFIAGGKGYYTPANIRAHIMNNQEYYYYKKDEKGNIIGTIVVTPNINGNSVVNITAFVVCKDKSDEEKIDIEKGLIKYAWESMTNQVNKMRISFYAKHNEIASFLHMFLKLGFILEAELKNECIEKSLFLYSLFEKNKAIGR